MEALKLISLFILIYSSTYKSASADSDALVANAIVSILSEHFANHCHTVRVISFGESEEVLEEVLRNKIDSVAVEVSKYTSHQEKSLTKPSLLLFDSFDSFVEWDKHLVFQTNRGTRFPHLIYVQGATFSDIETLKWGFDGDSTNFLIHEGKKSITLVTGYMFGPSKCGVNQFVVINRFNSSVMKWESSTFYPEKFQNFHGCALNISRGRSCETLHFFYDILAIALNFTLNYFENDKNADGMTNMEIDLFCDIAPADETLGSGNQQVAGTRIFSAELVVIAPYGDLFTSLEKLFMPFYFEVWVAIFVTLLVALGVIQIINRCTQDVRNAFYGENNTPTLSLAEMFLCGSQLYVPRRSPARFIMMMMIIWCLIIRTCYQSDLYKYLQSESRKPGVQSVADIVEQNFTFYGASGSYSNFEYYSRTHGMTSIQWKDHDINDYDIVAEPENKAVMFGSVQSMTSQLNIELRSGVPSLVLLDEVIMSFHLEFKYRSGVAFKKVFDRKTTQLLEGGFTARWIENARNNGKIEIKRAEEEIGPQVLTMDHLGIGFIAWLIPLAFSVIVFVYEVGKRPCREFLRHVRDAIVARSLVLAFIAIRSNVTQLELGRPGRSKQLEDLRH